MPDLIRGHLRFTADDDRLDHFQERALEKYKSKTDADLLAMWQATNEQLALMKDTQVMELFDTRENVKKLLAHAFTIMAALASRTECTLPQLLSF
jgi:hypothetical protein